MGERIDTRTEDTENGSGDLLSVFLGALCGSVVRQKEGGWCCMRRL
jgi:hypothetical protein